MLGIVGVTLDLGGCAITKRIKDTLKQNNTENVK